MLTGRWVTASPLGLERRGTRALLTVSHACPVQEWPRFRLTCTSAGVGAAGLHLSSSLQADIGQRRPPLLQESVGGRPAIPERIGREVNHSMFETIMASI